MESILNSVKLIWILSSTILGCSCGIFFLGRYIWDHLWCGKTTIEVYDLYKYKTNKIIDEQTNLIKNDFITSEDFCKKNINSYIYSSNNSNISNYLSLKLSKFYDDIFHNENIEKNILPNLIKKYENNFKKVNYNKNNIKNKNSHLNILLIGPTGTGKSELINDIFNATLTETSTGESVTKYFEIYNHESLPNITLIDSRGIELSNEFNSEIFLANVVNYIKEKEKNQNISEIIHCIWYCKTGNRLENVEKEILKQLNKIYTNKNHRPILPIIFVYTMGHIKHFIEAMQKEVNLISHNIIFKDVLGKDLETKGGILKSYGLKELLNITENSVNITYENVINSVMKFNVKEKLKFELRKVYKENQLDFCFKYNTNNFKEYIEIDYFEHLDVIKDIIESYIGKISHSSEGDIAFLYKDIIKELKEINKKCVDDFIDNSAYEVYSKYKIEESIIKTEYKNQLTEVKTYDEIIKMIKYQLKNKLDIIEFSKYIFMKNVLYFINNFLYSKLLILSVDFINNMS